MPVIVLLNKPQAGCSHFFDRVGLFKADRFNLQCHSCLQIGWISGISLYPGCIGVKKLHTRGVNSKSRQHGACRDFGPCNNPGLNSFQFTFCNNTLQNCTVSRHTAHLSSARHMQFINATCRAHVKNPPRYESGLCWYMQLQLCYWSSLLTDARPSTATTTVYW